MRYRELGRTGLRVSPLCLGAMNFGGDLTDDDEAVATISAALDRGINFIDTANVYNCGGSETVVGTGGTPVAVPVRDAVVALQPEFDGVGDEREATPVRRPR